MVWVDGGTFRMGSDEHYAEEAPAHLVEVDGFWVETTTVTNAAFRAFVEATAHVTVAEKAPRAEEYPGAKREMLVPGSLVFVPPGRRVDLNNHFNWWDWIPGADWRHPQGPDSSIAGLDDHPVVHVAWDDVCAYAEWAGRQLPTEAEWEFAARGGLDGAAFTWGDRFRPDGTYMANTWQGEFPIENKLLDGWYHTAPVGSYPPNGYGLYDMAGNVWEWTSDWYATRHDAVVERPCCAVQNPRGPSVEGSEDPADPVSPIPRKVLKGGSYLCAANYCRRYRPASRIPEPVDTSTGHLGFRCILRPTASP
jgi:sulfatase modifying factor 1